MTTSAAEIRLSPATGVRVSDDTLAVDLADGRTISVPLEWFPRLVHATAAERDGWQIGGGGGGGGGVRWPDLDEDISVEGLLAGRASQESQSSLKRWLNQRQKQRALGGTRPSDSQEE